eukprot:m.344791 g.344791  ORF g.344791 m.344791 type:complete len:164 (-) comp25122_c0_seq1:12-503(-)
MASGSLSCSIGKDGLDVGTGLGYYGRYTHEGEVKNREPNGYGIQTAERGEVTLGFWKDGEVQYPYVIKDPYKWEIVVWVSMGASRPLDDNNKAHTELMEMAQESAAKARELVNQPWSRSTHFYDKFRAADDVIFTVLLCGERLRQKGQSLPLEILELILSYTF